MIFAHSEGFLTGMVVQTSASLAPPASLATCLFTIHASLIQFKMLLAKILLPVWFKWRRPLFRQRPSMFPLSINIILIIW